MQTQETIYEDADEHRTLTVNVTLFGWAWNPRAGQVSLRVDRADGHNSYVVLDLDEMEKIVRAARKVRRKAATAAT